MRINLKVLRISGIFLLSSCGLSLLDTTFFVLLGWACVAKGGAANFQQQGWRIYKNGRGRRRSLGPWWHPSALIRTEQINSGHFITVRILLVNPYLLSHCGWVSVTWTEMRSLTNTRPQHSGCLNLLNLLKSLPWCDADCPKMSLTILDGLVEKSVSSP